jgi:hypothetical protein
MDFDLVGSTVLVNAFNDFRSKVLPSDPNLRKYWALNVQ